METIFRKGIFKILKVFYDNDNLKVHLRELARRTNLNENSISRFLNELVNSKILISVKEDAVRKFYISTKFSKIIFSIFDFEKFEKLSFNRKKSVKDYISQLKVKPSCLILFGSSAKGQIGRDSDLDLLEISESKFKVANLLSDIEAERGIRLQVTRLSLEKFNKAVVDQDSVILSAVKSGFPVFGKEFFYEVIYGGLR